MHTPKTTLMCGLAVVTVTLALLKKHVAAALSLAMLAGVAVAPPDVELRVTKALRVIAGEEVEESPSNQPAPTVAPENAPANTNALPPQPSTYDTCYETAVANPGIDSVNSADSAAYRRNVSLRTAHMPEPLEARNKFVEGMNKIVFGKRAGLSYTI